MSEYSGNNVDDIVRPFLPDIGWACDVGASDGVFFSNTLAFEERGWTVLCIEANPLLAEKGQSRRKLWRAVAAGAEDAEDREFFAYGSEPYPSWSSLAPIKSTPGQRPIHAFKVPVRRLDRLLEEVGFDRLDFLTIDAEGYEPEILAGFTVERWKPKVIVAESWKEGTLATPPGYSLIRRVEYDNIFIREGA